MANIADAAQHIDRLIASKREQIARQARGIVEDMTNLAASAEKGYHLSATPIQHAATYLNTLCGELSALVEARTAVRAAE